MIPAVMSAGIEIQNSLEPLSFVKAFVKHPPQGFCPFYMGLSPAQSVGFTAKMNLLLTLDHEGINTAVRRFRLQWLVNRLISPNVFFIGTSVTEYAPLPKQESGALIRTWLAAFQHAASWLCIVKDLPFQSPLLSQEENAFSLELIRKLEEAGFITVEGQVLGYLPIDFATIQEYLQRMSAARRKNLRRKLKAREHLDIREVKTGDDFFTSERIETLYQLYLNVFENSETQFDRLSLAFFTSVFQDTNDSGLVFIYQTREPAPKIIGFNLCYTLPQQSVFIDKYIGLSYPESREYNLYFVSWFHNLEYCLKHQLSMYIAGGASPEVKSILGACFTYTVHAVYLRYAWMRFVFKKIKTLFEADTQRLSQIQKADVKSSFPPEMKFPPGGGQGEDFTIGQQ